MRVSRRSSITSAVSGRTNSIRIQGRVTKEDVRSASLRRWDGRSRVTTDWLNLYHEPELCFPTGDLLIYLREPGQSSRGPSFRIHKAQLRARGFHFLIDNCISRPPIHPGTKCLESACHGCDKHPPPSELYIPAPSNADLDDMFDHHITTRNFFAWLYNLPLAGRALGRSLVTLKERIDYYRPGSLAKSSLEVVSYAETQKYLDFRECVDHALAALLLAEFLRIEDLWVDAFCHCVGMSHRGLNTSLEYWAISYETRVLINQAHFGMERRIESVRRSVCDFFEHDFSGNFLGLPQAARDQFDQFRSWLHSYHIEQHGFWPPTGFGDPMIERGIYMSMYSDFRNLYHHLVDPNSSVGMTDLHTSLSGGVCTTQNIQAFDAQHQYESLPKTMPRLPREPVMDAGMPRMQRRKSWNPLTRRKIDKDKKKTLQIQALITASNRDWAIMECPMVRKFSEFELQTTVNDSETVSMVDGRKVRWILIYAILQTLISVMQTPAQVRNADGVTYPLCCRPPKRMPWHIHTQPKGVPKLQRRRSMIEPDTQYKHSNISGSEASSKPVLSLTKSIKERRRQSLPAREAPVVSRPSSSRRSSLKRLITRGETSEVPPMPKSPGFCEIMVHGYGNGLNETTLSSTEVESKDACDMEGETTLKARKPAAIITDIDPSSVKTELNSAASGKVPDLTPTSSPSVSRESSNASSNSIWSKGLPNHSDGDLPLKDAVQSKLLTSLPDLTKLVPSDRVLSLSVDRPESVGLNHVLDEDGLVQTVHLNTESWDHLLHSFD